MASPEGQCCRPCPAGNANPCKAMPTTGEKMYKAGKATGANQLPDKGHFSKSARLFQQSANPSGELVALDLWHCHPAGQKIELPANPNNGGPALEFGPCHRITKDLAKT